MIRRGLLIALVLAVVGCSKEKKDHGAPVRPEPKPIAQVIDAAIRTPERPGHLACPADRPAGHASPDLPGMCRHDGDCTDGKNGRCNILQGGRMRPHNACSFDGCLGDADCKTGGPCECDADRGNACRAGNCQVDGDCGGFTCGRDPGQACGGGQAPAFFCRTAADTCHADSDCRLQEGRAPACTFVASAGHWDCVVPPPCPPG